MAASDADGKSCPVPDDNVQSGMDEAIFILGDSSNEKVTC